MAFIVKSAGPAAAPVCPLARAPWDRIIDVYKLALMGESSSRRMWNDYMAEVPGTARLIVKSVEAERAENARVTAKIDKQLRRAEKPVKPAKVKNRKKAASLSELDRVLAITDPERREHEYNALQERRGQ